MRDGRRGSHGAAREASRLPERTKRSNGVKKRRTLERKARDCDTVLREKKRMDGKVRQNFAEKQNVLWMPMPNEERHWL